MGSGDNFTIVDTPGFGDTDGEEGVLIEETVKFLKNEIKSTNVFLLLFHGQRDRLTSALQSMLREITMIFGDKFWDHTILGFSHWQFNQRSVQNRQRK